MNRTSGILLLSCAVALAMVGGALADYMYVQADTPEVVLRNAGETGAFNTSIVTDHVGEIHTIEFTTNNPDVIANMTGQGVDTGPLNVTGSGTWTATSAGTYNFTVNVMLLSNGTLGAIYISDISGAEAITLCSVTTSVTPSPIGAPPIPELPTIILVSIGLICLFSLGRRKN